MGTLSGEMSSPSRVDIFAAQCVPTLFFACVYSCSSLQIPQTVADVLENTDTNKSRYIYTSRIVADVSIGAISTVAPAYVFEPP